MLRTKGPARDMLPANSPPSNGKASHKRKAPAALDSPTVPASDTAGGEAKEFRSAAVKVEEHAPAKKLPGSKGQAAARKPPKKRGKSSESSRAARDTLPDCLQAAQPEVSVAGAVNDGLPQAAAVQVDPPTTDAGPANAEEVSVSLANGHISDVQQGTAALAAATGPGEGVPAAAALPGGKKRGGWPKGKPRRNHIPTGKVRCERNLLCSYHRCMPMCVLPGCPIAVVSQ